MKHSLFLLLCCLAGAFLTSGSAAADATPSDRPIVYAHYMHCYILGGMAKAGGPVPMREGVEDFDHWPLSETMERPWWSARLAPLACSGMEGVKTDFDLAQAAGVDAFGLLIGADHLPQSQFAPGMNLAAQCAETSAVKLFPDLWPAAFNPAKGPIRDQWVAYGKSVKDFMDAHPGAFMKRGDRWVISIGLITENDTNLIPWDNYKAFFEPWGGPDKFYILTNTTWHTNKQPFNLSSLKEWDQNPDALGMWCGDVGWGDRQNEVLFQLARDNHKDLSWPINSNYFGGRQGCESMGEDLGISRMCDQWRQAIRAKTAFAAVQTWNDFSEDHGINETNYRGDSLVDLTRYFADWYHAGKAPPVQTERIFLFHHRQLVGATLSQSTILAHNDSWHATPTVDYLNVVTMLKSPATVTLKQAGRQWTETAPAGLHEWLVYVPSAKTQAGPLREAFTRPDGSSYPVTSPERTVTVTDAIPAGKPTASVERDGKVLGEVDSRASLADTGRWQDLCMIGDEAVLSSF